MFKYKEKIAPPVFHSLFTPKPENKYNIRSRGKLTEQFCRNNVPSFTEQKMKFFFKDFFSKCDQVRSFLRI